MKKILALVPVLLLTGCLSAPVKRTFPDVPVSLLNACPRLAQVDPDTTKLSEVIRVVTDNYTQYHECRIKLDGWTEWYKTQRSIFEEVK
jgi:hypothetical protein